MRLTGMILKEVRHRRINFLLTLLAATIAVTFCVAFFTMAQASKRETIRTMRDLGQNLRIIAKQTDMGAFWDNGYSDVLMPEEWVHRFESVTGLFYSHLSATLQRRLEWEGHPALLNGMAAEVSPPDRKKPSMIFNIEPGTAYLGFELARHGDLKKGDTLTLNGKTLTVARTLAEQGSDDDIRIYVHLSDAQAVLGLEGQINEIQALDCYCRHPTKDTLTVLREQLATVLPGAKVIKMQTIALAREKQRTMMEDYLAIVIPMVILACGIWIGAMAMLNTRERQPEIGVLRALGYGSAQIAGLFLGRSVLIGLVGAAAGFILGTALALTLGPDLFELTAKHLKPSYDLLGWSLLLAPAFAALSSFIPSMLAVVRDPAVLLRTD